MTTPDTTPESSEYTSDTRHIRAGYCGAFNEGWRSAREADFDRWLAAHDAEVWDQGALAEANRWTRKPVNPYRAEQIGEH